MSPEHHAGAVRLLVEIEGIVLLTCRMLRRHIERSEIVEIILDVRTFGDREAEIAPDLHDFFPDLTNRMDRALRLRPDRKSDVELFRSKPRLERRLLKRTLARRNGVGDFVLE